MTILHRKLLRDLAGTKRQVAAIVAMMAVGVSCYVGLLGTYQNLELAKQSYYIQCQMADFWIPLKKAPAVELAAAANIPGVSAVRSRISFRVTVDVADVAKPLSGRVVSMPDERRAVINDVVLKRGSYFSGNRRNEVIISEQFAKKRRLKPGDRIHLLLNNQRKELIVVGTADSAEFTYLISPGSLAPDPANFSIFYLPQRYVEEVFDFEGAGNELIGRLDPAMQDTPEPVLQKLESRLASFGVVNTISLENQESNFILTNEILQGRRISTLLSSMFLIVAALVLNILMTRSVEQQRTVIGTLKALGYSKQQLRWHFLLFGMVVGLSGGVLGCAIGFWFADELTEMYTEFFSFPQLENEVYPWIFVQGLAVSLLAALAGSWRGIRAVYRLSPAESMRAKPPVTGRRILLERWRWLWNQLRFDTQMVLRGLSRNRIRSLAAIIAAAMGASILLTALYYRDAFLYLVEFQYQKVDRSDYTLVFQDEQDEDALRESTQLPGVQRAEQILNVACTLSRGKNSKKTSVQGLIPHARLTTLRDVNGERVSLPRAGLLLSRKLAEVLDVSPGERLMLVPVKGQRRPRSVAVAGLVDNYFGLAAYADHQFLNRLIDEESALSAIQLKVDRGLNTQLAFYRELKRLPSLENVSSARETEANLKDELIRTMNVMTYFEIGFAAVIFFGSILNVGLISLSERQRDVATFRVLGYEPRQISRIFLRESLLLNSVGTLLGLPLGYAMSMGSAELFDTELFQMPRVIQPLSWAWTILLALAFCLIAHQVVQQAVNKMNWLEAVKVNE